MKHWHAVEITGHGATPEGPEEYEPSEGIYRSYREAFSVAFPRAPSGSLAEIRAAARWTNQFVWTCTDPTCRDRFGPEWWDDGRRRWREAETIAWLVTFACLVVHLVTGDPRWGSAGIILGLMTWSASVLARLWREHHP